MLNSRSAFLLALGCALGASAQTVAIHVDAGKKLGPLKPI
jgi:hypothetical protein